MNLRVAVAADSDVAIRVEDGAIVRFEVFLFSAIGTILVNRAFLAATGYPKLGSGGLHIAHVLWGGLLMGVAVVMLLAGIGTRIRFWAALVAGIGFGLFIDEVGKFVTRDVNYFYKPAVAIMYVLFVFSYLLVRWILLRRRLSDPLRVALAATALTDQALGDLDAQGRAAAIRLLDAVATPSDSTAAIRAALISQPVVAQSALRQRANRLVQLAWNAWTRIVTARTFQLFAFALLAYEVWHQLHTYIFYLQTIVNLNLHVNFYLWYLEVTNLLTAGIVGLGLILVLLAPLRRHGLWLIQFGLLFDLLFDQFSTFKFSQFQALTGFAVELIILLAVRFLLSRERAPSRATLPSATEVSAT